jgi:sugar lactone lactonase YvrE
MPKHIIRDINPESRIKYIKRNMVMAILLGLLVTGCTAMHRSAAVQPPDLEEVAQSSRQWTGIAVMPDDRFFVNYPRWSNDVPVSVAELLPDGSTRPFPNLEWNGDTQEPGSRFVCVQSVVADREGFLWVLDSGNPRFAGVIPGAPKLLKFDVRDGRLLTIIPYAEPVIVSGSYLNDVRIDTVNQIAYLSESGAGALIVTDLRNGSSRRLLDNHPSVKAEDIDVIIDGVPWRHPGGAKPRVHADGIALSPDNSTIYFQALTGRTLYRIDTTSLRDPSLTPEELGKKVQKVGITGVADGIEFTNDGSLYLTSLEDHAIKRLMPDGTTEVVVRDNRLQWPDSLAGGPDGSLYVTTSRINLGSGPYGVFRFKP